HHAPALRVTFELRFRGEDLVDCLVKCLPLNLAPRAKLLREAFQYEARHQCTGAINIIASVAAQATETLDKRTGTIRFKDEIIDAKIDADIDGRGADQDSLFERTAPLLRVRQAGIFANANAIWPFETLFEQRDQAASRGN